MSEPENVAYCMDCMEFMATMPDKAFDLAVVDPPYGIRITDQHRTGKQCQIVGGGLVNLVEVYGQYKKARATLRAYPAFDDSSAPDAEYFKELFRVSKNTIVWGANFLNDHLPRSSCFLIWDKKRRGLDQADCEIAWTNLSGQSRIFEYRWNGMLQEYSGSFKEERIHPTQKPVALYAWIFRNFAKPGMKILDTHLGSGSIRIAAWDAGLEFVGCEIDEHYFRLQEERFKKHTAQGRLFQPNAGGGFEQLTLV